MKKIHTRNSQGKRQHKTYFQKSNNTLPLIPVVNHMFIITIVILCMLAAFLKISFSFWCKNFSRTICYSSSNFAIKFSIIQSMSRRFQTVWNSGIGALKFARATRSRRFLVGTSFTTATFAASGLMRKTVSCQDNQNTDKLNVKNH